MNELRLAAGAAPVALHPPTGAERGTRARRWAIRVGAGAWAAAVFVLWMPYAVEFPGTGLDASWAFGLVLALNAHMQWGSDIVFTYGPLGVLDYLRGVVVDPDLWLVSLSFAVIVNLAFAVALAFFLSAFEAHPLTWVLALIVFLLPVPIWALPEIELLLLTIMVFTLAVRVDRGGSLLAAAGGSLIALQVLGKGTLLISGGSILAGFAVAAWLSGRRWLIPPALASLVVFFAILYAAAGQTVGSLPGYLRTSFELVAGYTPAMSTFADQPSEIHPALLRLFGLALVPLTAGEVLVAFRRRNRGLLALTLISLPMMFLSFKEGFVRWHIDYFVCIAALLQLLILVAILGPRRRRKPGPRPRRLDLDAMLSTAFWRRQLPSLALPVTGVALLLPVVLTSLSMQGINPRGPAATLGDRIATYAQAAGMVQSSAERDRTAMQSQAIVLGTDPLPPVFLAHIGRASVDVMPWDIDVIAANHLNWTPRPVLQSYTSYTPYLDEMDASFLRGPGAPEYIITTLRTIDNRYALFEEPAAQRALLERYRAVAVDSGWVLLRRDSNICPCQVRELGSMTAAAGQRVRPPDAPPGERVFVRVGLDYSIAGRAANLLVDSGAVRVKLSSAGTESTFRLVPGTASDGLLLSAFVRNPEDLASTYSGCDRGGGVDSISVVPDNAAMFVGTVSYEFFAERTGPCIPLSAAPKP